MGLADPLGDSLTSSMAHLILSRRNPPNARLETKGSGSEHHGSVTQPVNNSNRTNTQSAKDSKQEDSVILVSRTTKSFLDGHPVFVDADGNEVRVPKYKCENDTTGRSGTENRPPKMSDTERIETGKLRSKQLWKKINPGYVTGVQLQSEYAASLALTDEKLHVAKFGSKKAFKHHLQKTDTSVYVEAVAKERIFAKAAREETVKEMERASAVADVVPPPVEGDASAAAPAPPPTEQAPQPETKK